MFRFTAKKFSRKILKVSTPLISTLLLFSNVQMVAADYLKVTAPAEIFQGTPFEIELQISAQANSTYNVKARIGSEENQLNKAQTLDSQSSVWLSDSIAWSRFPQIQTNQDGSWTGKITVKASNSSFLGNNLLIIRIRNSSSGSLTDSEVYSLTINAAKPTSEPQPKIETRGEPTLNEFMPQPSDGKEWVEIKNKGLEAADISGWKIDDEEGKSTPDVIAENTIIPAGGFFVMNFTSAKLNDLTDYVRLLKPDDSVVETYTYNKPTKGESFAKNPKGVWLKTQTPTPNTENIITSPEIPDQTLAPTSPTNEVDNSNSPQNAEAIGANTNKVPDVLGKSSKIATVSASFLKKDNQNNTYQLPFIAGGTLLLTAAFGFLFKNRLKILFNKLRSGSF